jgi:hypothetical protein
VKNQTRKEPKDHLPLDLILEKIILGIAAVGDNDGGLAEKTHLPPLTGCRRVTR